MNSFKRVRAFQIELEFEIVSFEVSNLTQQFPTTRKNMQRGNLRSGSVFVSLCNG